MIRSSTAVAERSTANTKTIHKEPTYHVFYVLRKVPIYLSYFVLHPLHLNYASSWKQDCLPFSLRRWSSNPTRANDSTLRLTKYSSKIQTTDLYLQELSVLYCHTNTTRYQSNLIITKANYICFEEGQKGHFWDWFNYRISVLFLDILT